MYSTGASRQIAAAPAEVYQALIDGELIGQWRVPEGMTTHVHQFEAREGGSFRVSLTYDRPNQAGKSSAHTDTYGGRFVRLVENELVVEALAFETADPALAGEMTMTTTITPNARGCLVELVHDGVPDAVSRTDNEIGMEMALSKLATLVEASTRRDG